MRVKNITAVVQEMWELDHSIVLSARWGSKKGRGTGIDFVIASRDAGRDREMYPGATAFFTFPSLKWDNRAIELRHFLRDRGDVLNPRWAGGF